MAMANANLFAFSLLILTLFAVAAVSSTPATPHAILSAHNFPVGLLPSAVSSYNLNSSTGHFTLHLSRPCKILLPPDNYLANFAPKITGTIVPNKIAELDGIKVWAFFKWWYITGIKSAGDDLVFEVGVVSAKYPSKNFDESPVCQGASSDSS